MALLLTIHYCGSEITIRTSIGTILKYETLSQLNIYFAGLLHSRLLVNIVSSSYERSSAN